MPRHTSQWFTFSTLAVTLVACSSGSDGGPTGGGGGNVTLDASQAVNDSIGSAGGVLTATSTSGVTYTLTIPAGALQAPTRITLTPIKDQQNLPVSGGFAAGADFQPAGLQFAQPVRLAAHPLPAAPAGMQLIAVTFEGDGDSLGLAPLADSSGTLITFLTHFSAASFIFGTTADLELLAQQTTTGSANQAFLNQLAALGIPLPPGNPAALPILQAWFASVILPELQGAGTDAELLLAVGDYGRWAELAFAYLTGAPPLAPLGGAAPLQPVLPPSLATEVGQASQAAAPVLRNAIAGNNAVCLAQHSLQALSNVLYWQSYAHYFGVDTPAEQLDSATVLANICGQVVETSDTLATTLQAGFPHTLVVGFALRAGGAPIPGASTFAVTVSAIGATIQNPSGNTNAAGFWGGSVITALGNGPVIITARGCLLSSGTTVSTGVCGTATIFRGSLDLTGSWAGVYQLSAPIGGPVPIELQITQVQNAIQGTFNVPIPNGPFGSISGLLSGDTIFNFTLDEGAPCNNRVLSGLARLVNGEIRLQLMSGPGCLGTESTPFAVARTSGPQVHGLYVGTGKSCVPGCLPTQTWSTLVLQIGDTLLFIGPHTLAQTQATTDGFTAIPSGADFSGDIGNTGCWSTGSGFSRPSCAPGVVGPVAPTTVTVSGTTLHGVSDFPGRQDVFDLQKQ